MRISENFGPKGNAIRSPDTNCELTFPGITHVPPVNPGCVNTGAKPSVERTWPPRLFNAYTKGWIGRLESRPSPVRVEGFFARQAKGMAKRRVEPDSPQSMCPPPSRK